jgi:hypothetical protein
MSLKKIKIDAGEVISPASKILLVFFTLILGIQDYKDCFDTQGI